MSDYYHTFLASVSGGGANTSSYPPGTNLPPAAHQASPIAYGAEDHQSPSDPLQNMTYYTGFTEPIIQYQPPSKSHRSRRKSAPGSEHVVKHRRTRSGCFTCRARRVKCDESRPICERCRKGKRDCLYPDPPPASSKKSGSSSAQSSKDAERRTSPSSSVEDDEDTDPDTGSTSSVHMSSGRLSHSRSIPEEDEGGDGNASAASNITSQPGTAQARRGLRRMNTSSTPSLTRLMTRTRQSSETPSQDDFPGSASSPISSLLPDLIAPTSPPDWSHLPPDLRAALDYFNTNITHWCYGVIIDSVGFFHTTFLTLALRHEALLHAVVAYTAYHRMIREPHGRIQDFLGYYTHAVTLLLGTLKKREGGHDLGTLLTILQLATIEECFGDMMHLMGHQKAAQEILTQLFTPQSIVATPMGRIMLCWYMRIDLLLAPIWGLEPALPRLWHENLEAHAKTQLATLTSSDTNTVLPWIIELADTQLRILFRDMSAVTSLRKSGVLTDEEFQAMHKKLALRLREWKDTLHPALTDPSRLAPSAKREHRKTSGLFNYYETAVPLYESPLQATTMLLCHWHVMVLMHLSQVSGEGMVEASGMLGGMGGNAEAVCQMSEAAEDWANAPRSVVKRMNSTLLTVAMFMPQRQPEQMWLRRKFAWLERQGAIFPLTLRNRLAQLFDDETAVRWWLPNDEEFTPILQSVRAFADERNRSAQPSHPEQKREMKDLWDAVMNMRLHDRIDERPGEE